MDDRATKFRKFIEDLPRLCSPTICGTLSQPLTKAERSNRSDKFEWSLEQKAILSPANITTATCSDIGEMDHSFLHQESEQFFSQKTIAPSPMTTPSTRNYSRSQPVPTTYKFNNHMFDERDEDSDSDSNRDDDDDEEDDDEDEDDDDDDRRSSDSNSDTDIDMEVLHDDNNDEDIDDDDDDDDDDRTSVSHSDTDTDHDDDMTDEYDNDDDNDVRTRQQDMDTLFLSPPLRSSQTQQRVDIFSPETFGRVMEDECTLQSTPKTIGSQVSRTRTRRGSGDMFD